RRVLRALSVERGRYHAVRDEKDPLPVCRIVARVMSWFVVSLHYVAPLSAIDAAMRSHVAFLEQQRKAGIFIAWGRKVPRTGGIILACGESRAVIERIM